MTETRNAKRENELDCLFELIADHIDRDHVAEIDERYRRALAWEEVDRPPLIVRAPYPTKMNLPHPWNQFRRYTYREAFNDPAAMMQNELLSSVVPGLLIKDDSPGAIRNNHGTIQVATLLGADWEVPEDDFPWAKPLGSIDRIRKVADSETPIDLHGGILTRSFETLSFYAEKLDKHPDCKSAIQIAMPDLEGPLSTAEQLWSSNIYYAFNDEPELVNLLLRRITDVMLVVSQEFREYTLDRLDPLANAQHGYMIPGRILIRNDSAIMLSAAMYGEFVRPHDARILRKLGGGSIHFCGNGQQLIEPMLCIPDLQGLDLGQADLMDLKSTYYACRERGVAITCIIMSRDNLISGRAQADFPTGSVFVYNVRDFEDGQEVMRAYKTNA